MRKISMHRGIARIAVAASLVGGAAIVAPSPAVAATVTRYGPVRKCELIVGTVTAFACVGAISKALADALALERDLTREGFGSKSTITSPSKGTRRAVVKGTK